jgi:hypothetical protein
VSLRVFKVASRPLLASARHNEIQNARGAVISTALRPLLGIDTCDHVLQDKGGQQLVMPLILDQRIRKGCAAAPRSSGESELSAGCLIRTHRQSDRVEQVGVFHRLGELAINPGFSRLFPIMAGGGKQDDGGLFIVGSSLKKADRVMPSISGIIRSKSASLNRGSGWRRRSKGLPRHRRAPGLSPTWRTSSRICWSRYHR